MDIILENDHLKVKVKQNGAELFSVLGKETQLEYMWSGDPAVWGKTSPVLFPIVGTLKENTFLYKDKKYKLSRHGFARDHIFEIESKDNNSAIFLLKSNVETIKDYPFHFEFRLRYELIQKFLQVTYDVVNVGNDEIFFSVGGHPAFKVPLMRESNYEDYYLEFNAIENAGRWPISSDGLIENRAKPFFNSTNQITLSKSLFDKDALVFKNLLSNIISLRSRKHQHGLDFSFAGFPYLGLWAAKQADFICIEPWCGIADSVDHDQQIINKEGIEKIAHGKRWAKFWKVKFY